MDIEKYLKKEKLEKSVSNLKANDRVKQKILDESKDTDYEKWLFSLERKSLVKKNIKIVIAMSIVVAFLILLMLYTVLSNRFMDKLIQSDNYITLEYNPDTKTYSFNGTINHKNINLTCEKNWYYVTGRDFMRMYYTDGNEADAIPEFVYEYWLIRYIFIAAALLAAIFIIYRSLRKILNIRRIYYMPFGDYDSSNNSMDLLGMQANKEALVEATSKEEGEQIFSRTWYGRKYQQLNLISMEELYNSLLRTVLEKEARKDPYSVAVLYSYLYHKEHEVNRLTIALECVRYQVDPDEAMHYVHNN